MVLWEFVHEIGKAISYKCKWYFEGFGEHIRVVFSYVLARKLKMNFLTLASAVTLEPTYSEWYEQNIIYSLLLIVIFFSCAH